MARYICCLLNYLDPNEKERDGLSKFLQSNVLPTIIWSALSVQHLWSAKETGWYSSFTNWLHDPKYLIWRSVRSLRKGDSLIGLWVWWWIRYVNLGRTTLLRCHTCHYVQTKESDNALSTSKKDVLARNPTTKKFRNNVFAFVKCDNWFSDGNRIKFHHYSLHRSIRTQYLPLYLHVGCHIERRNGWSRAVIASSHDCALRETFRNYCKRAYWRPSVFPILA